MFLQLDTMPPSNSRDIPIHIFESQLRVIDESPTELFVKVPYKIETGEAERISVDHIARITPSGGSTSSSCLT